MEPLIFTKEFLKEYGKPLQSNSIEIFKLIKYIRERKTSTGEAVLVTNENNRLNASLGAVLLDSSTIQKRVRELGAQITADYKDKSPLLVGILKGASIFHADLVRCIRLDLSYDFMTVDSYGNSTSSSGEVRILKDLDQSLEGKDVLLVEDIVDTGLTLNYLVQTLKAREPNSLKIVALLNKPSRREIEVKIDYIGFVIPDEYVVRSGLDFDQHYRNLPDIHFIRKSNA